MKKEVKNMKMKALVKKRPIHDMDRLSITDPERYRKIWAVLNDKDTKKDLLDMVETVPLHYAYNIADTSLSPEDTIDSSVFKSDINEILTKLEPREEKILRMRFGIGVSYDHTLEEVGKMFDVTRDRIRQIEAKSLRKLRSPSRSEKIRKYWIDPESKSFSDHTSFSEAARARTIPLFRQFILDYLTNNPSNKKKGIKL
jgi:RNA polymerase sigma factor (sigma-70 family)